jgi:hypothetical protein
VERGRLVQLPEAPGISSRMLFCRTTAVTAVPSELPTRTRMLAPVVAAGIASRGSPW